MLGGGEELGCWAGIGGGQGGEGLGRLEWEIRGAWGLRWVGVEVALLPLPKPSLVLGLALPTDLLGLHDQF